MTDQRFEKQFRSGRGRGSAAGPPVGTRTTPHVCHWCRQCPSFIEANGVCPGPQIPFRHPAVEPFCHERAVRIAMTRTEANIEQCRRCGNYGPNGGDCDGVQLINGETCNCFEQIINKPRNQGLGTRE